MSVENIWVEVGNICRVCLETSNNLYPLLGHVPNVDEDISSMIQYCTLLEVTLGDHLPSGVCIPCFKTIRIAYNFVRQYKESSRKLFEIKNQVVENEYDSGQNIHHNDLFKYEHNQEFGNVEEIVIEYQKEDITCDATDENCKESKVYENKDFCREVYNENQFETVCQNTEISAVNLSEEQDDINFHISVNELNEDLSEELNVQKREITNFTCPICRQTFSKFEVGFVKHLSTHEDDKLECDKCSLGTTLSVDLYVQHYRKAHRFECDICKKSYGRRSGLYYHMKTHKNAKLYKCSYPNCTKSFLTRWCLTKHVHTHSECPKFVCSKCGSEFKTYGTYKYHQKTHDGNRSYLCTECGQTFLQLIHLKYHMWKHTGIKMFQCDMCHKSYTSQTQLKKHKMKNICGILPKIVKKLCDPGKM